MMVEGVGATPRVDEFASDVQKVVLVEGVEHPIGPGAARTPGSVSQSLGDPSVLVQRGAAEPLLPFANTEGRCPARSGTCLGCSPAPSSVLRSTPLP